MYKEAADLKLLDFKKYFVQKITRMMNFSKIRYTFELKIRFIQVLQTDMIQN